MTLKLV